MSVVTKATQPLTIARPVTLRLAPSADLLAAIRGLGSGEPRPPFLRLTLEGLERPDAEVTVRVFVNRPDASRATPIDEPHYVGEVGFFPTTATPGAPPDSTFLLAVGRTLANLPPAERLIDGRYLDVTLIAVPLRATAKPEDLGEVAIRFEGVRLSAHQTG